MAIPLPLSERNLILTGYTGPNQPLIGKMVGERLKMPAVNIETLIAERAGLPVDDIRSYYGQSRLKNIEAEIMAETLLRRHTVIRVSASSLLNGDTLARLQETGVVLCLITTLDAMLHRLHTAMGARYYDPQERAAALSVLRREWSVRGQPGVIEVDTTAMSPAQIVEHLAALWQEIGIERV